MSLNLHLTVRSGSASREVSLYQTPTEVSRSIADLETYGKEPSWTKYFDWLWTHDWARMHVIHDEAVRRTVGYLREQGEFQVASDLAAEYLGTNKSPLEEIKERMEGEIAAFAKQQGVSVEGLTWEWWVC